MEEFYCQPFGHRRSISRILDKRAWRKCLDFAEKDFRETFNPTIAWSLKPPSSERWFVFVAVIHTSFCRKGKKTLGCVRGSQHCIVLCWAWTICATSIGWQLLVVSSSLTPRCVGKLVLNISCVDTRATHIDMPFLLRSTQHQHCSPFVLRLRKKWKIVLCGVRSVLSVKKVSLMRRDQFLSVSTFICCFVRNPFL